MNQQVDLFEHPHKWPSDLKVILLHYITKEQSYSNLINLEKDLLKIGYSIDFGLDCVAYNLRKI